MLFFPDPLQPLVSQFGSGRAFAPPVDVIASESDVVLTMDVPGLTVDDLSIELTDGYLVVRGERKQPQLQDGSGFTHRERAFGSFERIVKVPGGVDGDAITASIDHGVLSLIVPKPERLKPKSIAINSGSEQKQLETAGA